MKSFPIVRQSHSNACAIAVIRAILKAFEKVSYSENDIIRDFPYLYENGLTPFSLSIRFWNERGYCSEKADNQTALDIAKRTVDDNTYAMTTLEIPHRQYHCILFGQILDNMIYYMDPAEKGSGLTCKSIAEFEELRKIKKHPPSCTVREVVYVWKKNTLHA